MESNRGKITLRYITEDFNEAEKEISIDEYAKYLDMGDGEIDWDHFGWWAGQSDQDAFMEMIDNCNPFDVKEMLQYFLEKSKVGLMIYDISPKALEKMYNETH